MDEIRGSCLHPHTPSFPCFRNENSKRLGNSLGGRWRQREPFQPKFEDCIKVLGRKNLVLFKVLGEVRGEEIPRGLGSIHSSGYGRREGGRCLEMSGTQAPGPDSHVCDFPILQDKFLCNWFVSATPPDYAVVTGCSTISNPWRSLLIIRISLHLHFRWICARIWPQHMAWGLFTSQMLRNCAHAHTQTQLQSVADETEGLRDR